MNCIVCYEQRCLCKPRVVKPLVFATLFALAGCNYKHGVTKTSPSFSPVQVEECTINSYPFTRYTLNSKSFCEFGKGENSSNVPCEIYDECVALNYQ